MGILGVCASCSHYSVAYPGHQKLPPLNREFRVHEVWEEWRSQRCSHQILNFLPGNNISSLLTTNTTHWLHDPPARRDRTVFVIPYVPGGRGVQDQGKGKALEFSTTNQVWKSAGADHGRASSVIHCYINGPSMNHVSQNLFPYFIHSHIDFELGHLTVFGRWDISKCDARQTFRNACTLRLALLGCCHHVGSPGFLLERPNREEQRRPS